MVACECSGEVRRAFAALGHEAYSCDLQPSEDRSPMHYTGSVFDLDLSHFDMMIAHPPCTHLAGSGARWLTDHWVKSKAHPSGRYWHDGAAKRAAQVEALAFVLKLWNAPIARVAIENPVGMLSSLWRAPDQYIQPWEHGHGETKKTGLWIRGMPLLVPSDVVSGRAGRIHAMAPGPERTKERSRTYPGIARAMAAQWGGGK